MKFGLVFCDQTLDKHRLGTAYQDMVEQVVLAEKRGFDAAMVCEHHFTQHGYYPSPLLVCAGLAQATKRIRIGSAVLLLPLWNPLHVAEDAATLDVMSNGRVILGLGQGYRAEEFGAFQVSLHERGARLTEGAQIIRRLFAEEKVTHQGRFYQFAELTLTPKPIQKPHPPIWIAAKSDDAVRRAARIGDAFFSDPVTPFGVLKQRYRAYQDELQRLGRDFAQQEHPMFRECYVAERPADAWEEAREHVLGIYGDYYQWGHLQDEEGNLVKPGERSYDEFLEVLRRRFIMGEPDTVIAEIERYQRELGTTELILRIHFPDMPQTKVLNAINLLADKVMPHFGPS
jgi:probable F420-dependent oxidoreductase